MIAVQQAVHLLGQPEGDLALANAVIYLCQAPRSNAVYAAYGAALADVAETRHDPVPLHLRNAPTALMRGLGYGRGYRYAHDAADARVDQQHFPDNLIGRRYYQPTDRGFEAEVRARLRWREALPPPPRPDAAATSAAAADPQARAGEESQIVEAAGEEAQLADDAPPPVPRRREAPTRRRGR
jgi:putative ATPase